MIKPFKFFFLALIVGSSIISSIALNSSIPTLEADYLSNGELWIEICDFLDGKRAAVTASIDSLIANSYRAPNGWGWTNESGSPFSALVQFRNRHPQFKLTMMLVPSNRYGLDINEDGIWDPEVDISDENWVNIKNAPPGVKEWVVSVQKMDWIELADHGKTHSPDSARNLHSMEFDAYQNPNSLEPDWAENRVVEILTIFEEIGLNNSQIHGFRGPGFRWTDPVLSALVRHGFDYVLPKGFLHNHFRPRLMNVDRDKTFREEFRIHPYYYNISNGMSILMVPTTAHPDDPHFEDLFNYIIYKHGIINFFYHLTEPVYPSLEERVAFLETFDSDPSDGLSGDQLWWATCGEITLYWIRKDSTRLLNIILNDRSLHFTVESQSTAFSPVSLLIKVESNNIKRVTINNQPVNWLSSEEGAIVTLNSSLLEAEVNIDFHNPPIPLMVNRSDEKHLADLIFTKWESESQSITRHNLLVLLYMNLLGFSFLGVAELFIYRNEKKNNKSYHILNVRLLVTVLLGIVGIMALAYLSRITAFGIFAVGFSPTGKAWLYFQNLTLNDTNSRSMSFSLFGGLITGIFLLVFNISLYFLKRYRK